jgi:Spy/CpxP family protein refolding chaperone
MNRNRVWRTAATAVAAGILLSATSAPAQTPTLPRSQAEFEQQVGLTADQKKKIEALKGKYQPKIQAVQKKYEPEARRLQQAIAALQQKANKELKPLADQYQKEIDAILTPAQRAKIKQMNEAQMKAMQQQGGGGRPR